MAVVVEVRDPGALVDRELGLSGVAGVAGAVGLSDEIAELVDSNVAGRIRDALAGDQVDANVYVSSTPPAPTSSGRGWIAIGLALVAGVLIGRAS